MSFVTKTKPTVPFNTDNPGAVPAPTSADVAAQRSLRADGTWLTPISAGIDGGVPGSNYGGITAIDGGAP